MKHFYLQTFGCKLNQADGAAIRAALKARGLGEAESPESADFIIVNTCTVTGRADRHARSAMRRLKRAAPSARLIVTGCYPVWAAEKLAAMPEVDDVFGLAQRHELYRALAGPTADGEPAGFEPEIDFGGKTRAFLKVQEGCDRECSYCIVRLVRGPVRSLPSDEVMRRLAALAESGFSEVVLTGTHLGLWGTDLDDGNLVSLLRRIDGDEALPRIRLCSLEPFEVGEELVALIAGSRRIAHHLHLAVQSGSEVILGAMNRPPEPEAIRSTVERARVLMPDCGIGADVIVGFPGETDDDFEQTYALLTGAPFTYAHVFAFSPRPGTEAASLPNRVHPETIKQRSARLRAAMAAKNLEFRRSLIGTTLGAVALDRRDDSGRTEALTDNYIHVAIEGAHPPPKTLLRLQITAVERRSTRAKVADS